MRIIWTIAVKDLLLAWRDRLGFFWWMIGFPLLISVFIGLVFSSFVGGNARPVNVGLVDESRSAETQQFMEHLHASKSLNFVPMDLNAAQQVVRKGQYAAFLQLKTGFEITPAILWGRPLAATIGVDPMHQAESAILRGAVQEAAFQCLIEQPSIRAAAALLQKYMPAMERSAIQTASQRVAMVEVVRMYARESRPTSPFEVCFPLGMLWGMIGLAAELAIAAVREREMGIYLRIRIAPLRQWQLLAGSSLACFIAATGVILLLLTVGHLFFHVRIQSPIGMTLAIPAVALCFVGIRLFLSSLGNTESAVGGVSWAVLLLMSMLGGGMVPQMFLPEWMDRVGSISPVRWAIRALEGAIWRGFSVNEMLLPVGVLLLQGTIFALVGLAIQSRRRQ